MRGLADPIKRTRAFAEKNDGAKRDLCGRVGALHRVAAFVEKRQEITKNRPKSRFFPESKIPSLYIIYYFVNIVKRLLKILLEKFVYPIDIFVILLYNIGIRYLASKLC